LVEDRYSILFEPVKIGPKVAKNRFYQVPHCSGTGFRWPQTMAQMRGMKAEGGWGVVCTEECEIHPSADLSSFVEMRLWSDSDIPVHQLMTDKVHQHQALAGIQLVHNGIEAGNRYSRTPTLSPSGGYGSWIDPIQSRPMDRQDIRALRKWYRDAAKRALKADYDIVYVYAGHGMTVLTHFLQSRFNQRTDEYGGSLENRARLLKEVLLETKDVVGHKCAVALRFAVDDSNDQHFRYYNEGREVVEMLADLPDLWDVNIASWENDSITSRFGESGHQAEYIDFVKKITSKPVVGVGRFTSPDAMVAQIKRGILDFIGAARPSIADPFLPNKIAADRVDEIRECIGCNICTSGDYYAVPIRCTQNPTMGEEWRKNWHPEKIEQAGSDDKVLVVGSGPAGLECGLSLAKRGYDVVLAEKETYLGGRVYLESKLPGLSEWSRVIDHRTYLIDQRTNIETYVDSELTSSDILEYGFERVVLATGSKWNIDGTGHTSHKPISISKGNIVSVDQLLRGDMVSGHVVIYDDDGYYMANVLAELLVKNGCRVTYVTPSTDVAPYTHATLEQFRIQARLIELGVDILCAYSLSSYTQTTAGLECIYSGKTIELEADILLPVTSRSTVCDLYSELDDRELQTNHGIKSVDLIGDSVAPGTIAAAVYAGHQYARQLDNPVDQRYGFARENYPPVVNYNG